MYKPALREISIPNVKLGPQWGKAYRQGDFGEEFYVMTPAASISVRIDMNVRPMMKMESAILS
jgi:hypothetical protein